MRESQPEPRGMPEGEASKAAESVELSPEAEEAAEKAGRHLETVGEQLAEVDAAKITPEQFNALEGKVRMVIGVLAALAGIKMMGFGFDMNHGISDAPGLGISGLGQYVENALRTIGFAVSFSTGLTTLLMGGRKFLGGLEEFASTLPKVSRKETAESEEGTHEDMESGEDENVEDEPEAGEDGDEYEEEGGE
jgi:hypothetical protein